MKSNLKLAGKWTVIVLAAMMVVSLPSLAQKHNQNSVPRPPQHQQSAPPQHYAPAQSHPPAQSHEVPRPPAQPHEVPHPPQTYSGASPGNAAVPSQELRREVPHPPQAGHAGAWLATHRNLSAQEQQKALESDPQFKRLTPLQQDRLKGRLEHFNSLPPQQQQRMLNRMETWEHLTPDQKQNARQLASELRQLPPGRRDMMQTAIRDLRQMPPDQREQVLESSRFKSMFSEHEQSMLKDITRLPLAPADAVPRP